MAMAKKYLDGGKIVASGKGRAVRYPSKVFNNSAQQSTPSKRPLTSSKGSVSTPKSQLHSTPGSPRTSPGLLAGHYAGCKFSEPPSPSTLPLPPQHWMQSTRTVRLPFHPAKADRIDGTQQLKMLLKVQA